MKKTKIIATIGPATETAEKISALIAAGVNVFRLNTKHADVNWHQEKIELIRRVIEKEKSTVAIFVDLQGPEIRIQTPNDKKLIVKKGELVRFGVEFSGTNLMIKVPTPELYPALKDGDRVLIDDGYLEFTIVKTDEQSFSAIATDDYEIATHKGMNVPGVKLDLPSLAPHDFEILDMLTKVERVDYVGLSFVRSKADIDDLKAELIKRNLIDIDIIAKIEGVHAIEAIDEIIEAADGVMVARGDLGVELPIEEVVYWQKKIIKKCRQGAKPVVTATEMLKSMTENPRPTRAEVSDVSNAVLDGTDAVMLSGETATGTYPIKAVEMMHKIIAFNEDKNMLPTLELEQIANQSRVVTHAVVDMLLMAKDFTIDAIIVFTETGRTVRDLARFRPLAPIYAVTESVRVHNQLALVYGVESFIVSLPDGPVSEIEVVVETLKKEGVVRTGQRVVLVHGDHWKIPGLTNTITIKEIG